MLTKILPKNRRHEVGFGRQGITILITRERVDRYMDKILISSLKYYLLRIEILERWEKKEFFSLYKYVEQIKRGQHDI